MLLVPVLVLTIQPSFKTEVLQKLIHDIAHMHIAAAKQHQSATLIVFSSSVMAVCNEVLV